MHYQSGSFATTSCKNVETLPWINGLSCFKSLLVTGLRDIILTSVLPPIQSCSSKSWVWSCIASNFDKRWRGGNQKHKIMDRPFMPKYGTVSHILLQLVVAFVITLEISFLTKLMFMILKNSISKIYLFFLSEPREEFLLRVTSLAQLPNFEG